MAFKKATLTAAIAALLISMSGLLAFAGQNPGKLRVMTFNIRLSIVTDGRDWWPLRRDAVVSLIESKSPDLVGLQEVKRSQEKDLTKLLTAYDHFGLPREDGKKRGERCTIFYKKSRLDLLDHGTFWLSETPEVPGTRNWDAAFPRVVTWGKFRDKTTGTIFFHFNTHFDHQGVTARKMSAEILAERELLIAGDMPAVVTGDFNLESDTEPYATMTSVFRDSRIVSMTDPAGPFGTSRSFSLGSEPGRRIDYIFVDDPVKVLDYSVLDDTYHGGRRPSDHMPVMVDLEI